MQKFVTRKTGGPQRAGVPKKKQFEAFRATELYCPTCRRAMPVRERLLLVLPEGEKGPVPVCEMRHVGRRQTREGRAETADHRRISNFAGPRPIAPKAASIQYHLSHTSPSNPT